MKPNHFKFILVTGLLALSVAMFFLQYTVFHDARDTFFYMLQDLAFLPLQVLLVTLFLERILRYNEKQDRLNKQNMVIGIFFSQLGVDLLRRFSKWDTGIESVRNNLLITTACSNEQFGSLYSQFTGYKSGMNLDRIEFDGLKEIMVSNREFLVGLLENQNLLEHEQFTDLLWAVFHLLEELMYRNDFSALTQPDRNHLAGDIDRVYGLLITRWIMYMQHLRKSYPYLFSLAMRTNPFDANARIEVR